MKLKYICPLSKNSKPNKTTNKSISNNTSINYFNTSKLSLKIMKTLQ